MDEPKTPEKESKPLDAEKPQSVEETPKVEEKPKEAIIGDTIEDALKKYEEKNKPEPKLVPEAVLLEYKNQNKELKKDIKELKELIESGATKKEVSEDLRDIAEEHGIDINFLRKLAKNLEDQTEKIMTEKFLTKIKPLEDKERAERVEKIFNQQYDKVLEDMPEYKDIANKEVIKERALNLLNSKKTFRQLLEESYGHLISGKRTLESARGRGGEGIITEIDFNRAARDTDYFKEIMSDPQLKKKYNEELGLRIKI